jgi:hypothetical protein
MAAGPPIDSGALPGGPIPGRVGVPGASAYRGQPTVHGPGGGMVRQSGTAVVVAGGVWRAGLARWDSGGRLPLHARALPGGGIHLADGSAAGIASLRHWGTEGSRLWGTGTVDCCGLLRRHSRPPEHSCRAKTEGTSQVMYPTRSWHCARRLLITPGAPEMADRDTPCALRAVPPVRTSLS